MNARVVVVGSELLGDREDRNGPEIARRLVLAGFRVVSLEIVADDEAELGRVLARCLSSADVVVAAGGLGPTADDVTREAAAAATGLAIVEHADTVEKLHAWARARGLAAAAPLSLRQARVLEGSAVVDNPAGMAPGSVVSSDGAVLILLPGPPEELGATVEGAVDAAIRLLDRLGRSPPKPLAHQVLRAAGLFETRAQELLSAVPGVGCDGGSVVKLAFLPRPGDLELHFRSSDAAALERAVAEARRTLGEVVYSDDGRSLAEVIVPVLAERTETVTVAESCTGGLVAAALTAVPGCSRVLGRTFVTYADEAKVGLLGVAPGLLRLHGAVSAECAEAMAVGARRAARADWAIAVTGIAGPDGGSPEKPVGLVHVGLVRADGAAETVRHLFTGTRDAIRRRSVQAALDLLRRRL